MARPVYSRRLLKLVFVLMINFATYSLTTGTVRGMGGCEGNAEACAGEGFDGCCDGTCDCIAGEQHEICVCVCC